MVVAVAVAVHLSKHITIIFVCKNLFNTRFSTYPKMQAATAAVLLLALHGCCYDTETTLIRINYTHTYNGAWCRTFQPMLTLLFHVDAKPFCECVSIVSTIIFEWQSVRFMSFAIFLCAKSRNFSYASCYVKYASLLAYLRERLQ